MMFFVVIVNSISLYLGGINGLAFTIFLTIVGVLAAASSSRK